MRRSTHPSPQTQIDVYKRQDKALDRLWHQFNMEHPADYRAPSMSVSDIIVLNRAGVVSCHYVDPHQFTELPGFFSGKNMLRAAEDSIEQNDNQLDGIINNTPAPSVADLEARAKEGQQISLTVSYTHLPRWPKVWPPSLVQNNAGTGIWREAAGW